MAAPLPENEVARLQALHAHRLLDTAPDDACDGIARLAAFVCNAPIATLSLIDAERVWFKSALGLDIREIPRDAAFCAHAILRPDELFVVPDATQDARFADNPFVTGEPHIRFYAGTALTTADGLALGSLCIADRVPRQLTGGQREALRELGRQAAGRLALAWAQVAQRTGEAKYRHLVESGVIGINLWDMDGRITWVNQRFLEMTGYTQADMEAGRLRWDELTPPEWAAVTEEAVRQIRERGTFEAYEKEFRQRDGTHVPVLLGGALLDGGTEGISFILDLTELRRAQQQIREDNLVLEVQKAQLEAANAELATLATTDPLTGLLNHRAFQTRLAQAQYTRRGGRAGTSPALAVLDLDNFRFFNDVYGHAAGDAVLRTVAERLTEVCGSRDAVGHFGGDEFTLLLADVGHASVGEVGARLTATLAGLTYHPADSATAIPLTFSVGVALLTSGESETAWSEALHLADERLRWAKAGGGTDTEAGRVRHAMLARIEGFSMLDALVTAVDTKDRYTRRHSEDVMAHSVRLAAALGWDARGQDTVAVAALLHDVGKIGVPDHILRKPGKLSDAEFEAIKQHPMMGAIIVQAVPGLEKTLDAVRHHHERWDGGGYPFGLRGTETPPMARLMAVADAYSAMTTDRPYRQGMAQGKALAILEAGSGTQWDPDCVTAFLDSHAPACELFGTP